MICTSQLYHIHCGSHGWCIPCDCDESFVMGCLSATKIIVFFMVSWLTPTFNPCNSDPLQVVTMHNLLEGEAWTYGRVKGKVREVSACKSFLMSYLGGQRGNVTDWLTKFLYYIYYGDLPTALNGPCAVGAVLPWQAFIAFLLLCQLPLSLGEFQRFDQLHGRDLPFRPPMCRTILLWSLGKGFVRYVSSLVIVEVRFDDKHVEVGKHLGH